MKITGKDINGNDVTVEVRSPTKRVYDQSSVEYSRAFRKALDSGAMLKDKLKSYYEEQGVWDKNKEERQKILLDKMSEFTTVLRKGGIPLKEARKVALDLKRVRNEFRELVAERQSYERNSAESLADNARFNYFMSACVFDESGNQIWKSLEEYEGAPDHPWVFDAANALANMLYGLQEDYEKNLVENEFLIKYNFADENLRLKNKDGHLIDEDGRLIDEDGRFIAYENGESYFVDKDGNRLEEFSPFLDDDGNPISTEEKDSPTE